MYTLDPVDEIQSHMLGVIAGIMTHYCLNPAQVESRYEYILSLTPNDITTTYIMVDEPTVEPTAPVSEVNDLSPVSAGRSWADYDTSDDDVSDNQGCSQETTSEHPLAICNNENPDVGDDQTSDGPEYVRNRREFCAIMHKKIRICPRYSTCIDIACGNFHVKPEHICPHVTRGIYCDTEGCDLIVIRACRKGKRCNDSECSFRHT